MKKYLFSINVELWLNNIEIEADNENDARDYFDGLTIGELIEMGNLQDYDIEDISYEEENDE